MQTIPSTYSFTSTFALPPASIPIDGSTQSQSQSTFPSTSNYLTTNGSHCIDFHVDQEGGYGGFIHPTPLSNAHHLNLNRLAVPVNTNALDDEDAEPIDMVVTQEEEEQQPFGTSVLPHGSSIPLQNTSQPYVVSAANGVYGNVNPVVPTQQHGMLPSFSVQVQHPQLPAQSYGPPLPALQSQSQPVLTPHQQQIMAHHLQYQHQPLPLTIQSRPLIPPIYNGINPHTPNLTILHTNPPIFSIPSFLSPAECDLLITTAHGSFTPAPVVGKNSGEITPSRTSTTCYLAREDVTGYVDRISTLTGKPVEHCELPQVGRYYPSQQYRSHYDAFDLNDVDGRRFAENGGQRVVTVLVYLNDLAVGRGGCTAFPRLKTSSGEILRVRPERGKAIVFFPASVDGLLDTAALHAAEPALDTKYVSQVWIRQGEYKGIPTKRLVNVSGNVNGLEQHAHYEAQRPYAHYPQQGMLPDATPTLVGSVVPSPSPLVNQNHPMPQQQPYPPQYHRTQ
mmetsp:Transcript_49732/g.58032  ORF Transcript_49732/g.58032 Transcript_49732/m.58032 type:complete len:506 (+) Transcript_49732:193-1710(+)